MKLLITGASGFVGAHLTAAAVAAGHDVRALVRSPDKLTAALAPLGAPEVDVRTGDVTDRAAVEQAVAGCDAVVHAANVYVFDPRRGREMTATNVTGTELVLRAAVEAGCDPVVHVSSNVVLFPRDDGQDPPLTPRRGRPYGNSKRAAEAVARTWQDRGAPVVTTYPGHVMGPHDPGPGEMVRTLRALLVPTGPFRIRGGLAIVDVGWLAQLHLALLQPGTGPRRVTGNGTYATWDELFAACRELTGRRVRPVLPTPKPMGVAVGATADLLQRVVPARMPFGLEQTSALFDTAPMADPEAVELVGPPPPLTDTLRRAIVWAVAAGHLTPRQAGALADRPGPRQSSAPDLPDPAPPG